MGLVLAGNIYAVKQGHTSRDTAGGVKAGRSGTDQFPRPEKVYPSLLLGVRVLDEDKLRVWSNTGDLGELNVVIDADTVMLQVEARVLESSGKLNY